jgi:hypothetical protein
MHGFQHMRYDVVIRRKSHRIRPTEGLDFDRRLVKAQLVVWRSAFPREKKIFVLRKDKEVLDWLLGLPHSARLTSKIS